MANAGNPPANVLDSTDNIDAVWNDYITNSGLIGKPNVSVTPAGKVTSIQCVSATFFGSTFSTDQVESSFEIPQPLGQRTDSILLGLDPTKPGNNAIPTGTILSAFQVNSSDLPPLIGAIVTVLNSPLGNGFPTFQIDTSPGSKNGIWIVALDSQTLEVFLYACFLQEAEDLES
jgi:hypothetical protein